jgi:hypothetical protein
MGAIEKTKNIKRLDVKVDQLVKQKLNPNKMSKKAFDLLVDNLNQVGFVDPIFVRPTDDGKYRIVGGHHRFDAALYLGFEEVPVAVVDHDGFDDDEEKFQILRMNMIKGNLDAQTFMTMYHELAGAYTDDILQEAFGFSDDAEWRKLVHQTAKQLPDPEMQKKFKEAAKEIKTIDGLSKLLNEMFTNHGDTLPYGYMVVDYGGERSVWLHASKETMKAVDLMGDICRNKKRTMDDIFGTVLHLIATGKAGDLLDAAVAATKDVDIPAGTAYLPTKQNLLTAGAA